MYVGQKLHGNRMVVYSTQLVSCNKNRNIHGATFISCNIDKVALCMLGLIVRKDLA